MAMIRTSCPDCGDVEFTTSDISVEVTSDDGSGIYRFICPECISLVIKSVESRTIDLLLASGVEQVYPLTACQIAEFAHDLNDGSKFEDAFNRLVREMR